MIRLILFVILSTLVSSSARAVYWTRQWIYADAPCAESQLWFLRSICLPQTPAEAYINAASNGRITIYVNGYNATTDVLAPYKDNDVALHHVTCEATPYIKDDTCRIAVWYSPFLEGHEGKQLSLYLYGKYYDGSTFMYNADTLWAWTTAPATTTVKPNESESINACGISADWNQDGVPYPLLLPVKTMGSSDIVTACQSQRIRKIYSCRLIKSSPTSLTFLSPFPFHGWARVTLRGMRAGTTITVNGLSYTCNGTMDEQACRRFTISPYTTSTIKITSPSGIKASNVMNVEAIDIW